MSTHYSNSEEFWNLHPCNARHADRTKSLNDADYFRKIRSKKLTAEPHMVPFMDLGNVAGKTILDVGCGIGVQAYLFAMYGADVTATDSSKVACEMAMRHAFVGGAEGIMVVRPWDYDNGSYVYPRFPYDVILAWGTLHHMRDPARVLAGLRLNCCGPDTTLKVMVYHRRSTKAWRLMATHGYEWRKHTEAAEGCPISNAYTRREAREMLEDAGWEVTSCEVDHIFRWDIPSYRLGQWREGAPWCWMPESMFHWLEKRFGWHLLLTARPA